MKLLLHPITLSLVIAGLIIWFLPPMFNKYETKLFWFENIVNDKMYILVHDFNHDGQSEAALLQYQTGSGMKPFVSIRTLTHQILDNWPFSNGVWLGAPGIVTGDYDQNGQDEIYAFILRNDSVFLTGIEPFGTKGVVIDEHFVYKGISLNHVFDAPVRDMVLCDLNRDGYQEVVFSVMAGYTIQPRAVFAYDIKNDTLFRTPYAMEVINSIFCTDIDNDKKPEILGNYFCPGNTNLNEPYSDSLLWLFVYDHQLKFKFTPKVISRYPAGCHLAKNSFTGSGFIVLSNYSGFDSTDAVLYVADSKGNFMDSIPLEGKSWSLYQFESSRLKDPLLIHYDYGTSIYKIGKNFKIKPVFTSSNLMTLFRQSIDINGDGSLEYIFWTDNPDKFGIRLVITDKDFKNPVKIDFNKTFHELKLFSAGYDLKQNKHFLSISTDDKWYVYEYDENPLYYFKYLIYAAIFLVLWLFFTLLFKYQKKSIAKHYETEKQLLRQQIAISKKQLEPHFMLNTLNYIGYMYENERKEDARYYFGKFSSLIHRGLKYADKTETTLAEELAFVRDYLILQKRRFNDDLEFSIEADEDINLEKIKIPHSLIYTFAENAVKHGLRNKKGNRKLTIRIKRQGDKTVITITDNGIGRKQSHALKTTGTGKGLSIIANIIEGYNKLNKRDISYEVKDLFDENGNSAGTGVRIVV
jgi:hypothetical protein